jgi:hypothetical protein
MRLMGLAIAATGFLGSFRTLGTKKSIMPKLGIFKEGIKSLEPHVINVYTVYVYILPSGYLT